MAKLTFIKPLFHVDVVSKGEHLPKYRQIDAPVSIQEMNGSASGRCTKRSKNDISHSQKRTESSSGLLVCEGREFPRNIS